MQHILISACSFYCYMLITVGICCSKRKFPLQTLVMADEGMLFPMQVTVLLKKKHYKFFKLHHYFRTGFLRKCEEQSYVIFIGSKKTSKRAQSATNKKAPVSKKPKTSAKTKTPTKSKAKTKSSNEDTTGKSFKLPSFAELVDILTRY